MDLKDKFDKYQTEVDKEAWENFRLLRNHQKTKKKRFFLWWLFAGGLLITSSIGILLYTNNQGIDGIVLHSKEEQTSNSSIASNADVENTTPSNDSNNIINPKKDKDSTISTSYAVNILRKNSKKDQVIIKKEKVNNPNLLFQQSLTTSTINTIIDNKNIQNENATLDNTITKKVTDLSLQSKNDLPTFLSNEDKLFQENSLLKIENPILQLLDLKIRNISFNNPISIIKPSKKRSNNIKINIGYADAYVNGFSLDNKVNKQGIIFQLEYYHEWNNIIGTGLSAGYANMVDRSNPTYTIKDKETLKFLHANLYLFLANEKKHKLFAKLGVGPVNTDRILGAFFIPASGEIERTFQINNITNIGFTVEGNYEYQLHQSFFIGAHYGIITHNDGGQYAGLSIGYRW